MSADPKALMIDLAHALLPPLEAAAFRDLLARRAPLRQAARARLRPGDAGFIAQCDRRCEARACLDFAAARLGSCDTVLVLGIGGSGLGARMLLQALTPLAGLEGRPDVIVLDNVDPVETAELLEALDPARTLVNVVTKSGSTAETLAGYLIARRWLGDAGRDPRAHFVFTTDPEKGLLRRIARAEHIPCLDVPPDVGGRFSVLTAVGLLPAALAGIDVEGLLDGAAAMRARCLECPPERDPAFALAALLHAWHEIAGRGIHVLMPYSARLSEFSDWFVQLWAESLGKKRRKDGRPVGPTPLAALGATDQHSQLQLFMEGPCDKVVIFLRVAEHGRALPVPAGGDAPEMAYLGGRDLAELLEAEARGTAIALADAGQPSVEIRLPRVDAHALGQLVLLFELATAYAAECYDVEAYDQPGVEASKRATYALMGRAGYEDEARRIAAAARAPWVI